MAWHFNFLSGSLTVSSCRLYCYELTDLISGVEEGVSQGSKTRTSIPRVRSSNLMLSFRIEGLYLVGFQLWSFSFTYVSLSFRESFQFLVDNFYKLVVKRARGYQVVLYCCSHWNFVWHRYIIFPMGNSERSWIVLNCIDLIATSWTCTMRKTREDTSSGTVVLVAYNSWSWGLSEIPEAGRIFNDKWRCNYLSCFQVSFSQAHSVGYQNCCLIHYFEWAEAVSIKSCRLVEWCLLNVQISLGAR